MLKKLTDWQTIVKTPSTIRRGECSTILSETLTKLAQQAELELDVVLALREHTKTPRACFLLNEAIV